MKSILVLCLVSVAIGLPNNRLSSDSRYSPLWLKALYDAYSKSAIDTPVWSSRQMQPNILTIMTDSESDSPVHRLLQIEPQPAFTGVLQEDPNSPQGISAVLNREPVPIRQAIALGVDGNPKVVLVSIKDHPENVAAVFLEDGKIPIVVNGIQDKLLPVSLQHLGGQLFRVSTDGDPSISPFYNLIKAVNNIPGLYEVVNENNEDGNVDNSIERSTSRSVASERSLETQSLNPVQVAQVLNVLQGSNRRQSLNPTQISQIINAMQGDGHGGHGGQSLNPTQIAQVINAAQSGPSSGQSLSQNQIAQVINAMQGSGGNNRLNPVQVGQVLHAMQDTRQGGQSTVNPTQIAQVINAMQSGSTADETLNPTQVAQVLHAMQDRRESLLNPTQITQVINAMQSGNSAGQSLKPNQVAEAIHALQANRRGSSTLSPLQLAAIIHALEPKPLKTTALNSVQIAQLIEALQKSNGGFLSASQIEQVIYATQGIDTKADSSSLKPRTNPSALTSKAAQVIHAIQKNGNHLKPSQLSQVIDAVQKVDGSASIDSSRASQVIHVVQKNNQGKTLEPHQLSQIIKVFQKASGSGNTQKVNAEQTTFRHGIAGQSEAPNSKKVAPSIAKVLHVLQRNNHGQPLSAAQIAAVIKAFESTRQKTSQTIRATQQASNSINPSQISQIIHAIQQNQRYPMDVDSLEQIIKAIQSSGNENTPTSLRIAQIIQAIQRTTRRSLSPRQISQIIDAIQRSGHPQTQAQTQTQSSHQGVYASQKSTPGAQHQGVHATQFGNGPLGYGYANQRVHAVQNNGNVNPSDVSQNIHVFQSSNDDRYGNGPPTSQSVHAVQNSNSNGQIQSQIAQALHAIQSSGAGTPLTPSQISQVIRAVQSVHKSDDKPTTQSVETTQVSNEDTTQATTVHQSSSGSSEANQAVHLSQDSQGGSLIVNDNKQ